MLIFRKKLFLKVISLLISIIFYTQCTSFEIGRLISVEEKINKSKVLGYKYGLNRVKEPLINFPTIIYRLNKYPIYEIQDVERYERIKVTRDIDVQRVTYLSVLGAACGMLLDWLMDDLVSNEESVTDTEKKVDLTFIITTSAGFILGLIGGITQSKKTKKPAGVINKLKIVRSSRPHPDPIPVKNFKVEFSCTFNKSQVKCHAKTNEFGMVMIDLVKNLKLTKLSTENQLILNIKFKNENNQIEEIKEILDPKQWLVPYSIKILPNTVIYEFPDYSSSEITTIRGSKELVIHEASSSWLKVSFGNWIGWLPKTSGQILFVEPEYYDPRNPPFIKTTVEFDDSGSTSKNGILDGNERAKLIAYISNREGRGKAHQVRLLLSSSNKQISLEKERIIGTIEPGDVKKVELPIVAPLKVSDDTASLVIETKEKYGNDAAPVMIKMPVRAIPLPRFDIRNIEINDRMKGFARGNGNGRIENGEIIELLTHIENTGNGDAQDVTAKFSIENAGIKILKDEIEIPRINPKRREAMLFAFQIPRTYREKSIKTIFLVKEGRGACELQEEIPLTVYFRNPSLTYDYKIYDGDSAQSEGNEDGIIQQGEIIELEVTVKNSGSLEAENVNVNVESKNPSVILNKNTETIGKIPEKSEASPISFVINIQRRTEPRRVSLPIKLRQNDFPSIEDFITLQVEEEIIVEEGPEIPVRTQVPLKVEPVVIIGNPMDGYSTSNSNVTVKGSATDDKEIRKIEVRVNDILLKEERGIKIVPTPKSPKRSMAFSSSVPLELGKNKIEISAIDNDGLYGSAQILVTRMSKVAEIWIVAIGINDYMNREIPDLRYALNDAQGVAEYFLDYLSVPEDHIYVLFDEEATLRNIKNILGTELKNKAKKEDTVIIYFAGHGAKEEDPFNPDGDGFEKYLLPVDADPDDQFATAFPMRDIQIIFERIDSQQLIFLADTCFSGAAGSGARTLAFPYRSSISEKYLERISSGKGKVILTASEANEVCRENEKFRHGIFTYYLLRGLKGDADYDNDGYITVDEISQYVKKEVSKNTKDRQHPVQRGESTTITLGRVKK